MRPRAKHVDRGARHRLFARVGEISTFARFRSRSQQLICALAWICFIQRDGSCACTCQMCGWLFRTRRTRGAHSRHVRFVQDSYSMVPSASLLIEQNTHRDLIAFARSHNKSQPHSVRPQLLTPLSCQINLRHSPRRFEGSGKGAPFPSALGFRFTSFVSRWRCPRGSLSFDR